MSDTNQAIPEDYGGPKAPTLNPSTLSFAKGGSNTQSTVITNPSSDTPMTWSVDHPQGSWWQLNTYTGMLSPRASQQLHVTVNKPAC